MALFTTRCTKKTTPKYSQLDNNYKQGSVDTQAKQRVRSSSLRAIHKSGFVSFQPSIRIKFNFFNKLSTCSLDIIKYFVITSIPDCPNAQKPYELKKITVSPGMTYAMNKLNKMIM